MIQVLEKLELPSLARIPSVTTRILLYKCSWYCSTLDISPTSSMLQFNYSNSTKNGNNLKR